MPSRSDNRPAPRCNDRAEALAEAARKGDAAAVKKLLDEGVDVNTKFRYGATALSYACDRGHLDVVKLLLDRGADVNVRDTFYSATPLTWAVSPAQGPQARAPGDRAAAAREGRPGQGTGPDGGRVGCRTWRRRRSILESGGLAAGRAVRRARSGDAGQAAGRRRGAARGGRREAARRVQDRRSAARAVRGHLSAVRATPSWS